MNQPGIVSPCQPPVVQLHGYVCGASGFGSVGANGGRRTTESRRIRRSNRYRGYQEKATEDTIYIGGHD
jgi:hypothetical protein